MERKIYLMSISTDSFSDPELTDEEEEALHHIFCFGFYRIQPVPWYLDQKGREERIHENVYIGSLQIENPLRPEEVKQLKDYFRKGNRDIECFEIAKIS